MGKFKEGEFCYFVFNCAPWEGYNFEVLSGNISLLSASHGPHSYKCGHRYFAEEDAFRTKGEAHLHRRRKSLELIQHRINRKREELAKLQKDFDAILKEDLPE